MSTPKNLQHLFDTTTLSNLSELSVGQGYLLQTGVDTGTTVIGFKKNPHAPQQQYTSVHSTHKYKPVCCPQTAEAAYKSALTRPPASNSHNGIGEGRCDR